MVAAAMPTKKKNKGIHVENDGVDRSAWWSRTQIVDKLGVSENTVQAWERKGKLKGVVVRRACRDGGVRNVVVYDPNEIARLPKRTREAFGIAREPGEIAARAFEEFREGASVEDVVIKLRQTPDLVEALREKWLNGGGADYVIAPAMRLELEKYVGKFASVAELVAKIAALAVTATASTTPPATSPAMPSTTTT